MSNEARLVRINDVKLLICQESLRVLNVILHVRDAFVNLSQRLSDWLAHLLSDKPCIFLLVFGQNGLQVANFFEPSRQSCVSL